MNPKLSSGISVVKLSDTILEFFKSNTRQQIRIKVQDNTIMDLVNSLEGTSSIEEIAKLFQIELDELNELLDFLMKKGILDNIEPRMDFEKFDQFRRTIYFLSDFAGGHDEQLEMWNKLRNSKVLIIGLGAVGTWVACNLVESGVENLILLDPDEVDITNLHRQYGYSYNDVGRKKTDSLEDRLKKYNKDVKILKYNIMLDKNTLNIFDDIDIDLIVNCADKPNVDTTTKWVGEYGMKRRIPHIIGGGYNMHLSLIGQTVLPGKSACAKCFQLQLEETNTIDPQRVKKLQIKNRKVGSFGPMCSLIASFVGMEAIKVLSGCTEPSNINRRGEFDIYTMDMKYVNFVRRDDCEWCGTNGKYFDKGCEV